MKNFSLRLTASLILHTELLCLVGLILFTDGHIPVRLVNPNSSLSSPYAGRLEVRWYYTSYGGWGTVCDDYFNDAAARVACYSLGFGRAGSFVRNRYGSGPGGIWLDDVRCNGDETDINSCSHRDWGSHNCQHFNDVSIECDVKECTGDESKCDLVSTACIVINGSNTCSCRKGFASFNETTCVDLDECANPPSGCTTAVGTCVNTIGSYICSCRDGYTQTTSTVCSDIDECRDGPSECNTTTGYCMNTNGSYNCSCNSGYKNIRSTMCTDIDECSTEQSRCFSASTNCVNTVGSYQCQCRNGYENKSSDSRSCRDINECAKGQSQCDALTTICHNTVGSYYCSCKKGYEYSTFSSCTDIDECVNGEFECDLNSTNCINIIGGNYTCGCKNGYTYLNETTCLAIEEPSQGRFGLVAIVGTIVGAFLVASIAILFLVFYRKRRNEVNQPQQTDSSCVDNGRGVADTDNANVYEMLDQTPLEMTEYEAVYTQLNAQTLLPVAP